MVYPKKNEDYHCKGKMNYFPSKKFEIMEQSTSSSALSKVLENQINAYNFRKEKPHLNCVFDQGKKPINYAILLVIMFILGGKCMSYVIC